MTEIQTAKYYSRRHKLQVENDINIITKDYECKYKSRKFKLKIQIKERKSSKNMY